MKRPRLLDLFCGAGGCSRGYHDAGFDVMGVDWLYHGDYPYELLVADAMTIVTDPTFLNDFDVVHASPPCQFATSMSNRHRGQGTKADTHVNLIPPVREALIRWGGLYVIENVAGARAHMRGPLLLRGGMFGLGVDRPRLFETNLPLLMTAPVQRVLEPVGVYGKAHDGRRLNDRTDGTTQYAAASLEQAQQAMGIDWMNWDDLKEAIPPAYTQFIGEQLLAHLTLGAAS